MAKSFPNTGATVIDTVADLPAASAALEGVMMFQKDTNELKICDGSSWVSMLDTDNTPMGAWINTSGTTISQSNAVTFTIYYSKYIKLGRLVHWNFAYAITGAGTAGTAITLSLPVSIFTQISVIGSGWVYDASTNTRYAFIAEVNSSNSISLVGDWSTGFAWGAVPSLGLANGDQIRGSLTYEADS